MGLCNGVVKIIWYFNPWSAGKKRKLQIDPPGADENQNNLGGLVLQRHHVASLRMNYEYGANLPVKECNEAVDPFKDFTKDITTSNLPFDCRSLYLEKL